MTEYFTPIVTQLQDEGFHVTASVWRPNAVTNARDYRVFLSHDADGDRASVVAIAINRNGEWRIASKRPTPQAAGHYQTAWLRLEEFELQVLGAVIAVVLNIFFDDFGAHPIAYCAHKVTILPKFSTP